MERRLPVGGPASLAERGPTYPSSPGTEPARGDWSGDAPGHRRLTTTVRLGSGESCWRSSAEAVMTWQVKTRSGFTVAGGPARATEGARYWLHARIGPVTVAEPVEVVHTVETASRTGFAYGTLDGHPVSGEEAFVVHRDATGTVFLTLRSLTAPAPSGPWSRLFPVLRIAQRVYRRRYLRALVDRTDTR
jgi:uncharacterized protein (UPF0548 family)